MINKLKRLSEITSIKDVEPLSKAVFPGTHCPLFGAILILKYFKDSAVIVLGTQECSYYTKSMISENKEYYNRCYSVIVNQNDVTFGCTKKLQKAVDELMLVKKFKSVFIITTCVIEITGDDINSLGENLTKQYDLPFMVVHTDHFTCDTHFSGMTKVLTQCSKIMTKCEKNSSVNILGHRHNNFEKSELYNILKDNNIDINLTLPAICSTEQIKNASKASVNIVCDEIGMGLAEEMKEKFNTPFIVLNKSCDIDYINDCYIKLFDMLKIPCPDIVEEKKTDAISKLEEYKKELSNLTYIYGNIPVPTLPIINFFTHLGMEAKLVQIKSINENDLLIINQLNKKNIDPYVTKPANIAPLQSLYGQLKPVFYIGHENPVKLAKMGIIQLALDIAAEKVGFEMPVFIAKMLVKNYKLRKEDM